jgi:hypothetical protein
MMSLENPWFTSRLSADDAATVAGLTHTGVRYPPDSSLLQGGVRVLTRTLGQASRTLGDAPGRVRNSDPRGRA